MDERHRIEDTSQIISPGLVVFADVVRENLRAMIGIAGSAERLRPHVKAHKCTELARRQAAVGHPAFTCATIREAEGLAAAGLGEDLLQALKGELSSRRYGEAVRLEVDEAAVRGGRP